MRYFTVLACGALWLAPAACAAQAESPGMSAWQYVPLERAPGILWRHIAAKDFFDTRFEYRWKSERAVDDSVCAVELRFADHTERSYTIPEVNIGYSGPNRIGLHFHIFTAHSVAVSNDAAHAFLKTTGCDTVELVSWRK